MTYSGILYFSTACFAIESVSNILFNGAIEKNWLLAHNANLQESDLHIHFSNMFGYRTSILKKPCTKKYTNMEDYQ